MDQYLFSDDAYKMYSLANQVVSIISRTCMYERKQLIWLLIVAKFAHVASRVLVRCHYNSWLKNIHNPIEIVVMLLLR